VELCRYVLEKRCVFFPRFQPGYHQSIVGAVVRMLPQRYVKRSYLFEKEKISDWFSVIHFGA